MVFWHEANALQHWQMHGVGAWLPIEYQIENELSVPDWEEWKSS